ncbi:hypothetical protein [Reichenbachiella agariperforans]|nr:hypothetical protein [Reichenbachiella agariperforans]
MKRFILLTIISMFGCCDFVLSQDILISRDRLELNDTITRAKDSQQQFIILADKTYSLFRFNGETYDTLTSIAGDDSKYDISKYATPQFESYKIAIIGNDTTEKEFQVSFTQQPADTEEDVSSIDPTQTPIPSFRNSKGFPRIGDSYKKNRYIIIDAAPNPWIKSNTQLLKHKVEGGQDDGKAGNQNEESISFSRANGIPQNGSVAVFIRGYNFHNLEAVTVSINESDYSYDKGLADIYFEEGDNEDSTQANSGSDDKGIGELSNYLDMAIASLSTIEYLNINDVYALESYKNKLKERIDTTGMTPDDAVRLGKILGWYPNYVSLTPIALSSEDADELEVSLSIKTTQGGAPKEYDLGSYLVSGGVDFDINSTLFMTDLANNKVYTDSVTNDSGTKELRAKQGDTNDMTVGIGLNSEISFRTGSIFRPLISLGFFVPFDEDITPNIAFGGGLSLNSKKVKLSISGGPAIGMVNAIDEKYKDRNLADFSNLTNEEISTKVWKRGWQLGIGLSYKLSK